METKYEPNELDDVDASILANLYGLCNDILNTQWKNITEEPLADYYQYNIEPQFGGKRKQTLVKAKLPSSAYRIVSEIDTLKEELKLEPVYSKEDPIDLIIKTMVLIETTLKSERDNPAYKGYHKKLDILYQEGGELLCKTIEAELNSLRARHALLSPIESGLATGLNALMKDIRRTMKKGSLSVTGLYEFKKTLAILHNEYSQYDTKRNPKEKKFFEKNIEPFSAYLIESQKVVPEATKELELVIKGIVAAIDAQNKATSPSFDPVLALFRTITTPSGNAETVVTLGGETHNLTKILQHQPNFTEINLNESELDCLLKFIQTNGANENLALKPTSFPVNIGTRDSKTIMDDLVIHLYNTSQDRNNTFIHCHAAECIAINIYTGYPYVIINGFLRDNNIPSDLFSKGSPDPNTQGALDGIESKFTKTKKAGRNTLTTSQANQLTLEALLFTVLTARGTDKAKHLSHDPSETALIEKNVLCTDRGRMLRGSHEAAWTEQAKKLYWLAYETGLPIYSHAFTSTAFNTKPIQKTFVKDSKNPLIIKAFPWSGIEAFGVGSIIYPISALRHEKEYLFPPCLWLTQKESPIKHKAHYGKIVHDKKITVAMVKGNGPNSFCYSTSIQKIRTELILMAEDLNQLASKSGARYDKQLGDQTLASINQLIKKFETQLKTIKITLCKEPITIQDLQKMNVINQLKGGVDGLFLMTELGKLFFIDKQNNSIQELTTDPQKVPQMIDLLNLKSEFEALNKSNFQSIELPEPLDIYAMAYLAKSGGLDLNLINHPKETLKQYKDQLATIEKDYHRLARSQIPQAKNRHILFPKVPSTKDQTTKPTSPSVKFH